MEPFPRDRAELVEYNAAQALLIAGYRRALRGTSIALKTGAVERAWAERYASDFAAATDALVRFFAACRQPRREFASCFRIVVQRIPWELESRALARPTGGAPLMEAALSWIRLQRTTGIQIRRGQRNLRLSVARRRVP